MKVKILCSCKECKSIVFDVDEQGIYTCLGCGHPHNQDEFMPKIIRVDGK